MTIPELLAERAEKDATLAAVITDVGSITYGELDTASREIASRLVAAGVTNGDRIGLLAPNSIEWVTHAYAVMRIGAVLVPLSTLLRPPELAAQLDIAEVRRLITVPGFRNRDYLADLASIDHGLDAVWVIGDLPEATAPIAEDVAPDDDMVVLFTSGSTSAPKGVIHTHGGALRATAAGLDARCVRAGERLYVPMPFFWTGGLGSGVLSALIAGATLLSEAEPVPAATLALLQREKVTLFRGWPDQAVKIAADPAFAAADLSSLGDASLGALLPVDRRPAPGSRPNIFGMTESFGPYCGAPLDRDLPTDKWGSCGKPFAGTEVLIVDDEICLRGPNLMRGICGKTHDEVFDAEGFFHTGDKGRLDGDGYLWYLGRLDDMFKVKGATVYPSEVEAALRSAVGVAQAFVTDVDGDVGAIVVTTAERDAIAADLKTRLSSFKMPTRWLLTADATDVPMTATGKVDKTALRALLKENAR